jgi:hypothetical protein
VEHLLYHLGSRAFEDYADDRSQTFVLTDRAMRHWNALTKSVVHKQIETLPRLTIKIPGKAAAQQFLS